MPETILGSDSRNRGTQGRSNTDDTIDSTIDWGQSVELPTGGTHGVLTRIDHIGIACQDLAAAIGRYEARLGLTVVSREVNEAQGVREAMLRVADGPADASYVQLLEPLGPDTPVGRFLARRGEGIHHVGYGVADITAALESIGTAGVRLLDARPRHGSMGASIAFLHPADLGGVLTELVQVAPRSG
jgi:methylmalonyl-CoA/ethylmalonyl-CoA epimerase